MESDDPDIILMLHQTNEAIPLDSTIIGKNLFDGYVYTDVDRSYGQNPKHP